MRSWYQNIVTCLPAKFLARITFAGIWGIALSENELEVKFMFIAILAVIAAGLAASFVSWDRSPMDAARMAVHGLVIGGEVLVTGAFSLAALGAFTGQLHIWPMVICAVGGGIMEVFTTVNILRHNIDREAMESSGE